MVHPQISVRLAPKQLEQIDALVAAGDFGNRGEFIQYAVRKILMNYESRSPPPPTKMSKGLSGIAAGLMSFNSRFFRR